MPANIAAKIDHCLALPSNLALHSTASLVSSFEGINCERLSQGMIFAEFETRRGFITGLFCRVQHGQYEKLRAAPKQGEG